VSLSALANHVTAVIENPVEEPDLTLNIGTGAEPVARKIELRTAALATPNDLTRFGVHSAADLGIHIGNTRKTLQANSGRTAVALKRLGDNLSGWDSIREKVIERAAKNTDSDTKEGVEEGANAVAIAIGAAESHEFIEVLRSLPLLPTCEVDESVERSVVETESAATGIRDGRNEANFVTQVLELNKTPLLDSLSAGLGFSWDTVRGNSRQEIDRKRYGYFLSGFALLKVFAEIM
jgi:hypothetical protein